MGDYLLEQCRRRNVTLRLDGEGDIEVEFDRAAPPHDLLVQLRAYKPDVVRLLRGFRPEESRPNAVVPAASVGAPDGGDRGGDETFRLFGRL